MIHLFHTPAKTLKGGTMPKRGEKIFKVWTTGCTNNPVLVKCTLEEIEEAAEQHRKNMLAKGISISMICFSWVEPHIYTVNNWNKLLA
jgi:hypothetical protein